MSLASSSDFHIRPEDTAFDSLFLADEDPLTSSFDSYLNENDDLSDGDNKETFDDFFEFFEKEARVNGASRAMPTGNSTRHESTSPQPWRKGMWCLNQQDALLPGDADWKDSSAPTMNQNVPNARHHSRRKTQDKPYTNFSRPNPRSPPHTPSHKATKRQSATSPKAARKSPYARPTYSREGTLSPTSMYARNKHNNGMAYQESLQQHLQNFHLPIGDEAGTPSPSRTRNLQNERSAWANGANAANIRRNGATQQNLALIASNKQLNDSLARLPQSSFEHAYSTLNRGLHNPPPFEELEYLPLDPSLGSPKFMSNGPKMVSSPNEYHLNQPAYQQDSPNRAHSTWKKEFLGSPTEQGYLYDVPAHLSPHGQSQTWWSPPPPPPLPPTSAPQPDAPHSYQDFYPSIAAPTPQRPTHLLLQTQTSPHVGGLGIHYDGIPQPAPAQQTYPALSPVEPTYQYPPLPQLQPLSSEPLPSHSSSSFDNPSPFSTPRHHHHRRHHTQPRLTPPSRSSPSPSLSPTNTSRNYYYTTTTTTSSRSQRQTSPTRPSSSTRRKSIGAPKASSFNKATPKTPTTTTPGGGGGGVVDFVNLTPRDSKKLLNDVAPSGSSKTRARREQEARDKKRRLSEAAVKAVRRAARSGGGGELGQREVEALERAILA